MGNILTKNEIHRISLKERGGSTLGGRKVSFNRDVLRLIMMDEENIWANFMETIKCLSFWRMASFAQPDIGCHESL